MKKRTWHSMYLLTLLCIPHHTSAISFKDIWHTAKYGIQKACEYAGLKSSKSKQNPNRQAEPRVVIPDEEELVIVEKEVCVICQGSLYTESPEFEHIPFTYSCNHTLHTTCAYRATQSNQRHSNFCPICRKTISSRAKYELFQLHMAHSNQNNQQRRSSREQTEPLFVHRKNQVEDLQTREDLLFKLCTLDHVKEIARLRRTHNQLNHEKDRLEIVTQQTNERMKQLLEENRQLKRQVRQALFLAGSVAATASLLAIGWYSYAR